MSRPRPEAPGVAAVDRSSELGRRGEAIAARALEERGFRIVARNARVGRAEIDLIVEDRHGLAFVEVKARSTAKFGEPYEAVDAAKRQRLLEAALEYLAAAGDPEREFRLGVVSVLCDPQGGPERVEWIDEAD